MAAMNKPTPAKGIAGTGGIVQIQSLAAVAAAQNGTPAPWVTIRNAKYSIKPKGNAKEIPNSTDGIVRIAGLIDYTISASGHTNPDDPIEADICPNDVVNWRLYRQGVASAANPDGTGAITVSGPYWSGVAIVDDLSIDYDADGTEDWDISASKQSGYLTTPAGRNL